MAATSSRPLRLHHHAFVVNDQEETRRFYEGVIGLPLVATYCEEEDFGTGPTPYCHTFFELEKGACLAFFQFADPAHVKRFGLAEPPSPFDHVALLATVDLQAKVETRAREAGVSCMTIDHGYCTSLYLRDPDGLMIELVIDCPEALADDAGRRAKAHETLERWLVGDHSTNNIYRSRPLNSE